MKQCPFLFNAEHSGCMECDCMMWSVVSRKYKTVNGIFDGFDETYGCSLAQVKEAK